MALTTILRPGALLLAMLAALPGARAAGLDCKAASSATERAICADATLRDLDATLARLYAQALHDGDRNAALRQQQRDWLQTRDACGAEAVCLTTQYRQRIVAFGRPDAGDMAALEELRRAVEAARRSDPVFPYEKAIAPLTIATGTTSFDNTRQDESEDDARFPKARPKGVTNAEWRALQASHIEGGGEHGFSRYTLMDLDGDGARDLVVNTYVGGTGLFSEVRILRQEGGKFVAPGVGVVDVNALETGEPGAAYLYAHGDRGGNAEATWVHLHGRVYALYRDGAYGVDNVFLLRPWGSRGQVPRLAIRYRYRLSAPAQAGLAPALQRALNAALARVDPSAIDDKPHTTPMCPVPDDASDDVREDSLAYGAAHYSIEVVADLPVHVGNQCYLGQLNDWFGRYTPKTGLEARLCIRKPGDQQSIGDAAQCHAVAGKRTAVAITAGTAPFEH